MPKAAEEHFIRGLEPGRGSNENVLRRKNGKSRNQGKKARAEEQVEGGIDTVRYRTCGCWIGHGFGAIGTVVGDKLRKCDRP